MDEKTTAPATVDEYIARFPPETQDILRKIRAVIQETAPQAEERIGYQMPGYYYKGGLLWFGAHKSHIGLYPNPSGLEAFKEQLSAYAGSKGSVHFPLDQPIPYDLIREIVKFRLEENDQRAARRKAR